MYLTGYLGFYFIRKCYAHKKQIYSHSVKIDMYCWKIHVGNMSFTLFSRDVIIKYILTS